MKTKCIIKLLYNLFFIVILTACNNNMSENEIVEIFKLNDDDLKFIDSSDRFGGFGEGFSLEEYEISKKATLIFLNDNNKNLPINNLGLKKIDWKVTPVNDSYDELFIMCLNYSNGNNVLEDKLDEIKTILKGKDVYYSFYYKSEIINPTDAKLFILDIKTRRVYVIESNI